MFEYFRKTKIEALLIFLTNNLGPAKSFYVRSQLELREDVETFIQNLTQQNYIIIFDINLQFVIIFQVIKRVIF